MLHVKIDLVPFGQEDDRKQISECFIGHVGQDGFGLTRYHVWREDPRRLAPRPDPDAEVTHARQDGCDALVVKALVALEHK